MRIPLSLSQERLWSLEKIRLNGPVYEVPPPSGVEGSLDAADRHHRAMELIRRDGNLRPRVEIGNGVPRPQNLASISYVGESVSVEALERGVCALMARHEILRARFQVAEQGLHQVFDPPPSTFRVQLKDLSLQVPALSAPQLQRIFFEETSRPFNLVMESPLRVMLWKLSATQYAVFVVLHEIICDEWSLELLVDELAHSYTAYSGHEPIPPPNDPAQYADYAVWEHTWFNDESLQQHIDFWKAYLKRVEVEYLLTDMNRQKSSSFTCGAVDLEISGDLSEKLLLLSHQQSVTPYALLLAAFEILLSQWSGRDRICVATFTPGRGQPQSAEMLGPCAKALAVRADLSGYRNFKVWAQTVQAALDEAAATQILPLEDVMTKLEADDLMALPRQRVGFRWMNVSAAQKSWSLPHFLRVSTQFDLALSMRQVGATSLEGCLEFASELLDITSAQRGADDLVSLLYDIVSDLK